MTSWSPLSGSPQFWEMAARAPRGTPVYGANHPELTRVREVMFIPKTRTVPTLATDTLRIRALAPTMGGVSTNGRTLMTDTFASLHEKLDFLLDDHGVHDFDDSTLALEEVSSLHAKANALCSAHGGDPSGMPNATLAELHPKLDYLLEGHGVDFDASDLELDTLASVDAKVSAIVDAHEDGADR